MNEERHVRQHTSDEWSRSKQNVDVFRLRRACV